MISNLKKVIPLFGWLVLFLACKNQPTISEKDNIFQYQVQEVRLGDGVPLQIGLNLRWKVEELTSFYSQYESKEFYQSQVIHPRSMELVRSVAHGFDSVDSIFNQQQDRFIDSIKSLLLTDLPEESTSVKEVIITNIVFPKTYTDAMEAAGLRQQELERIDQQKLIALAEAASDKEKAKANAEVQIARAEAERRIQKIKAQMEETRRKTELAKAETRAQIERKNGRVDADKKRMMVQVDLDKQKDLKQIEVNHQRSLDKAELDNQIEMAQVYQSNPTYASFLVNRELAGKVDIAVIPAGTDANVFGNFLKQTIVD